MLKAYKKAWTLFCVYFIIVSLCIVFSDFPDEDLFRVHLYGIAWIIVSCLVFILTISIVDSRKAQLINNCNPAAFIAHAQIVYPSLSKRDQLLRTTYQINLYAAHENLGEYEKAEEYLMQVQTDFPKNATGILIAFTYRVNLSNLYMHKSQFGQAEQEILAAEAFLDSNKINPAVKASMLLSCQAHRYELNMRQGSFEGAELFFTNLFRTEKKLIAKVNAQWNLAKIYRNSGNVEHAAAACRYVISNGGHTRYVRQAADLLFELSAKPAE